MINFLHINTTDTEGGAAVEMYRLHRALLEAGCGSRVFCNRKFSDDETVFPIVPGPYGWAVNKLCGKISNGLGVPLSGHPAGIFLRNSPAVKEWADVFVLRNLHGWYFPLAALSSLAAHAPIIWRLPDMWALTGHCAYSYDCERWQSGCGRCPYPDVYQELPFDTTAFLWKRKKKIYDRLHDRMVFVSPSEWLKKKVEASPLTNRFRCTLIPTAVDLSVFCPRPKMDARRVLNLAENEKVILLICVDFKDPRKGGKELVRILQNCAERSPEPLTVLAVGWRGEGVEWPAQVKIVRTGYVNDSHALADCYSAADVFLSWSLADNFPNTLVEAAACGLPSVCRDIGGCGEIVIDGETGYTAETADQAAERILELLGEKGRVLSFSRQARKRAEELYSMERQVRAFIRLAGEIVQKKQEVL